MSMLAEPRRKQKIINLRAKNNAWSEDNSKFGQRMLEKMGWSSGKGLGAKEDGIVEHVVARYKNDDKGLGFEDRNDQWTKHEDDFDTLLANLSNADSKEEKLPSGISLEVKSKKSKARIHYHKFTRGKDLSRYSEKDLANIFGKKSLKKKEKTEEILNVHVKTTDIFTEKGSMEDYFKNKLAAFKLKNKISPSETNENSRDSDNNECEFRGFSGTSNNDINEDKSLQTSGCQPFSFYSTEVTDKENDNCVTITKEVKKKSKKRKKSKEDKEIVDSCEEISLKVTEKVKISNVDISIKINSELQVVKVKKSKKRKVSESELPIEEPEECGTKKKKSRSKVNPEETEVVQDVTEDTLAKKKKKKKKKSMS